MQRFHNILVVIDEKTENKAVVERAATLAQRNQARVTVVNTVKELPRQAPRPVTPDLPADVQGLVLDIIEEWPPDAGPPITPEPSATFQESLSEWAPGAEMPVTEPAVVIREHIVEEESQRLEQWVDLIRRSGVQVSGKMLYGMPFLVIIREVLRNEHDLVMTTAEGRVGLKERLFGSAALHLMRQCPCPVWVVKPSQPQGYTRILAAVDPTPMDEERHALNIKIMDLATSLARRQQSELVVVHTWTFPVEHSLRSGQLGPSSKVDGWVRDARDNHRLRLAELLQPYALQDLKYQVYLLKGEAGHLIPELATEKEVDLIVMGTVSRTGVSGLLIGNTAEKILRRVNCSVLTVKPDGFITPVRLDE
jgi:nucleotide-binding universal stress UspA family protein